MFVLDIATLHREASDERSKKYRSKNLTFDLTCVVICELQMAICKIFGKVMAEAIKYRFRINNRSSSSADSGGTHALTSPNGEQGPKIL